MFLMGFKRLKNFISSRRRLKTVMDGEVTVNDGEGR